MAKSGCHVDSFGFKHCYVNEGLMLHYLCCQLHQHYSSQLVASEWNQRRWKELLQQAAVALPKTKEVKRLIRSGIPNHYRAKVWGLLIQEKVRDIQESKGPHYFNQLCSMIADSEIVAQHRRQISLDLLRTMPTNVHFNENDSDGVKKMQEVLQAFCLHNSDVGYCQGMNFIVGMALLFMQPDESFWFLVAITERYFPPHYFNRNLMGAQADQDVLKNLLSIKLPSLAQHLHSMDIELSTVTLNWFLAIFFESVPFETLLRIWDCFLYEGPKVLFRFSVAILRMSESCLHERTSTISIMRQLKASSRVCYDIEGLFKTAFEDLKPFPRRAEIVSKQACYLKTLQEKNKKRNLEREALEAKEKLLDELEAVNEMKSVIECASVVGERNIWICEGHLGYGRIMEVSVADGSMHWLNIELDSRIMCISPVSGTDVMLLGTLSRCLYAYRATSSELIWRTELNDSVLSVCAHEEQSQDRIYAALADGTVAVVERSVAQFSASTLDYEVFYIMVGSGPVSCLSMVDKRLWCACGNRIIILHARTLDIIDQFTVSCNALDIVSVITDSRHGVWILLRGSSTFQLWDPLNLVCRTMFDVKENRCPKVTQEASFSALWRVTAVLPVDGMLWVGIGDGHLYVYDVQILPSRVTSAGHSPHSGDGGPDGYTNTTMDMVTKRIEELYLKQCYNANGETDLRMQARGRSDSGYQTVGDGSKESSTGQQEPGDIIAQDSCEFSHRNSVFEDLDKDTCKTVAQLSDSCRQTADLDSDSKRNNELSSNKCSKHASTQRHVQSTRKSSSESLTRDQAWTSVNSGNKFCTDNLNNQQHSSSKACHVKLKLDKRRCRTRTESRYRLNHSMSAYELSSRTTRRSHRTLPSSSISLTPSSRQTSALHSRSYDDIAHLLSGSGDSLISSPTCDSFDFDDVFVTYTEDERWLHEMNNRVYSRTTSHSTGSSFAKSCDIPLTPRFILLTDEGSTGGDGGSSSGGTIAGGESKSCRRKCGSRHSSSSARSCRGKLYSSNTLHRKKETYTFDANILSKCVSSIKQALSPPLLIIGSVDSNRDNVETVNKAGPSSGSSLDDLSSMSHVEYDSVQETACGKRSVEHLTISSKNTKDNTCCWKGSDSGSFVSFSESDIPYSVELTLKEKQKIADKPIKCLLSVPCESSIISCAGSCEEPKSVLKWTTDKSKNTMLLWNSKAVVCLHPSESSTMSSCAKQRTPSPSSGNSLVHVTSNLVGSGLARMQNIISNFSSELPIS